MPVGGKTYKKRARYSQLASKLLHITYIIQRHGDYRFDWKLPIDSDQWQDSFKIAVTKHYNALYRRRLSKREAENKYQHMLDFIKKASRLPWYSTFMEQAVPTPSNRWEVPSYLIGLDLASSANKSKESPMEELQFRKNLHFVEKHIDVCRPGIVRLKSGQLTLLEHVNKGGASIFTLYYCIDSQARNGIVGRIALRSVDANRVLQIHMDGRAFKNSNKLHYYFPSNRFMRPREAEWTPMGQSSTAVLLKSLASQRYITPDCLLALARGEFPLDLFLFTPLEGADQALSVVATTDLTIPSELIVGRELDVDVHGVKFHLSIDGFSAFAINKLEPGERTVVFGAPITAPNYLFIIAEIPRGCDGQDKHIQFRRGLPMLKDVFGSGLYIK
ncbi:MAG: hypothetical protein ABC579_03290 [Candidatus Methanosuratincola petrocarbonis]|nr:hypothetical protein [Synergistales bacterium]